MLDDAFEEKNGGEKVKLGMVVSIHRRVIARISSLYSNRSFEETLL